MGCWGDLGAPTALVCAGDFAGVQPAPAHTRSPYCCSAAGLEDLLTAEEKEKLYRAIGYSGSSQTLALPKEVNTHLRLCVRDVWDTKAT